MATCSNGQGIIVDLNQYKIKGGGNFKKKKVCGMWYHVVSWFRYSSGLYRFQIFAVFLTFMCHKLISITFEWMGI